MSPATIPTGPRLTFMKFPPERCAGVSVAYRAVFVADRRVCRLIDGAGRIDRDMVVDCLHLSVDRFEEEQMKYPMTVMLLAAGTMLVVGLGTGAAQAPDGCAAQASKPQKKRALGGLLSSGLAGSIAGAMRGNANLASDLAGTAERAADGALASDGCAEGRAEDTASDAAAKPAAAPETATGRAQREMAANDAKYPSRMAIAEEWKTAKAAYDAFGKVRCTSCEGGYAYAGWIDWPRDEYSGKYNAGETRLSRLPIGHVHRWSSNGFAGTLTIDGEEQVNGFRCRKMTYRLEKGGQSAARPGLICWGKANEYAASDSWVGVF
jgi:hypothetical protein